MGRRSTIWKRKGRGFWSTIRGVQVFLAHDLKKAKIKFSQRMSERTRSRPGRHTIPELITTFLAYQAARVKKGEISKDYYISIKSSLQAWEVEYYDLDPSDMRAYHVREWLESHDTWNPTTRSTRGRRVKEWSSWLADEGYLDEDRLSGARLPTPLTREPAPLADLEKLLDAITEPFFRDFYTVLYDTGMRPGELSTLEGSRVNWSNPSAIVEGKTGQRVIGLTMRSVEILRLAHERYPTGPLLRSARGAFWSVEVQRRAFIKWCKIAHTSTHVTPYQVRHSLWQRWHAAGISDILIARQLGHSAKGAPSLKLLASTYSHPDAADLAAAARQVSPPVLKRRKQR